MTVVLIAGACSLAWSSGYPCGSGLLTTGTGLVPFKQTPNGTLNLRVYKPAGWKQSDRRPGFVMFFGGGWGQCCIQELTPYWTYYASQGFVVVTPFYRPSSNNPGRYIENICIPDAKSAVRWVRKHADSLGIDPSRIVGMGSSAGGHLAACTATLKGMQDASDDLSVSCRPNLLALLWPAGLTWNDATGMSFWTSMTRDSLGISPSLHLDDSVPPTLLMLGSADGYNPGSAIYRDSAQKYGIEVVWKEMRGAGHDFGFRSDTLVPNSGEDSCKKWCDTFLKAQGFWPGTTHISPAPSSGLSDRKGLAVRETQRLFNLRGQAIATRCPGSGAGGEGKALGRAVLRQETGQVVVSLRW
jgi:acetyl esterase/lipase